MVNFSEIAKKWSSVFAAIILLFISFISIGIRVFSVYNNKFRLLDMKVLFTSLIPGLITGQLNF